MTLITKVGDLNVFAPIKNVLERVLKRVLLTLIKIYHLR